MPSRHRLGLGMEFAIDFKDHFKNTGQTKEFEERINQALSVFLNDPYFAVYCSNNKSIRLVDIICPDCKKEITLNCNSGRLTPTESCGSFVKNSNNNNDDNYYYLNVPSREILILNKSQIDLIAPINNFFASFCESDILKGYYEQFGIIYIKNPAALPLSFHIDYENYCLSTNTGTHSLLDLDEDGFGKYTNLTISECYLIDKNNFDSRKSHYGIKNIGFIDRFKIGKGFYEIKYNDITTIKKIGPQKLPNNILLNTDISYSPLLMINYNGQDMPIYSEKIAMYKIVDKLFNEPSFLHDNGWISNQIVNPRFFKKPLRFNHIFDFVNQGEPFHWRGNFSRIKEHVKSGINVSKQFIDLIFRVIYSVLKYGRLDSKGNIDTGIRWIETRKNCYEIFEELIYQGYDVPSYWKEDDL